MGPKKKENGPQIKHCDALKRINFLYQASRLINNPQSDTPNQALSRYYLHTLKSVSKRLVLRLDPDVKETICSNCSTLLIPGVTLKVRLRNSKQPHLVFRCKECHFVIKRINSSKSLMYMTTNQISCVNISKDEELIRPLHQNNE